MPENSHKTLYRKWRPDTFQSVVGQEHITSILRHQIKNDSASHAYLFSGSRGTGKTTCAKIMAQAINCLSPKDGSPCGECEACKLIMSGAATDIVEMDAASNNGVDYIRDIKDEVIYAPAMLKSRVYIIDEVHMLSQSAFNALLKTLEEPPSRVVFILATTEIQKIPATIISRCQRFDFRRISTQDISSRLEFIAQNEGIRLTNEAARLIAKLSQGGMRDAISMLELCAGGEGDIDIKKVRACAGIAGRELLEKMVLSILSKKYESIFSEISYLYSSSTELSVFFSDLISFYRDMLVIKVSDGGSAGKYTDITDEELQRTRALAEKISKQTLLYHIKLLEDAFITMQRDPSIKRLCAEMTLIRMCDDSLDTSSEALLSRIAALEEKLDALTLGGTSSLSSGTSSLSNEISSISSGISSLSSGHGNGAANEEIAPHNIYAQHDIYAQNDDSARLTSEHFAGNASSQSSSFQKSDNAYEKSNEPNSIISNKEDQADKAASGPDGKVSAEGGNAIAEGGKASEGSGNAIAAEEIPFELTPNDIKHNSAILTQNDDNYGKQSEKPMSAPNMSGKDFDSEAASAGSDGVSPQTSKEAGEATMTKDGSSLHLIGSWAEIVSKIRKTDDGAASMLDLAKAYISESGAVEIIVESAFALMIVDNDDIKKQIASYLTATKEFGEIKLPSISFKHIKPEGKKSDPLSELGR